MLIGGRPARTDLDTPPGHLDPDAQDLWRFTMEHIVRAGVADIVDLPALEMMCTAYARWRQAKRVVEADGMFVNGGNGRIREHPALKIERAERDSFMRFAEQFGITPIARTRLGLAQLAGVNLKHELDRKLGAPNLVPLGS